MTSSIHNLCHLFRACGYCLDNSNKLIHSSDKGTVFLFCVMNQLFWLIKLRVHGLHDSVFTVYNCLNSVLHGSSKVKISPLSTSLSNSVRISLQQCPHCIYRMYLLACLMQSRVYYHLCSFPVLIGGPLPRGHEFELHDVRFHWGRENQRGSEHTVNFKAFPMEVRVTLHCIKPFKSKRFWFLAWLCGSSKEIFF